ncbi:hypothetical protein DPMN_156674 [Dreissena polymorpha]|uniref:Uncharacterized protein n=1 Tax=Dreissena polymorpha TaxID=45954 RepID=A0A9D4FTZ4_DREPO|nr:hypothetical protein DPMN_156674 [Dreissena polymorpha]
MPITLDPQMFLHPGHGAYPPCHIGYRLANGVAYPPPTSLKDVFFNWLLVCSSP